jgi:hypothetical protein
MSSDAATVYLTDAIRQFRACKQIADKAIAQVTDEELFKTIDSENNSVALIMKHMTGNMRSRWRDFLTSDGEKPDRHRDTEFIIDDADTKEAIMQHWEAGWKYVFDAVEPLTPDDLTKTVVIRDEPHTVIEAINRQMTHYALHTGQIIMLAKHFRESDWKTLSVPRGQSEEFNAKMRKRAGK